MNYNEVAAMKLARQIIERQAAPINSGFEELFQLDLGQPDKKIKHFKQVIPVSIHHFYVVEEIKQVEYYLNMINTIRTAEQHDTVFIYLNTPGGSLHTAIQIIAAIRQSAATIVTCLEGEVCSAGTMIFLAGHKHVVSQNCTFMIHNYSQWVGGKGNDITIQVKYTESYFRKLADDIYGGFLTKEEIESVLEGKDFWMESEEVIRRVSDKIIKQDDKVEDIIKMMIPEDAALDPTAAPPAKIVEPKKKAATKKKVIVKPAKVV
jgi:ATP-dependent Clp protease protease subunit